MVEHKTTIEITHTKKLTDVDLEYLLDQIKEDLTSGYPGGNISYWNLNSTLIYAVEDIAKEIISDYNKTYPDDVRNFDDKLEYLKQMLIDRHQSDYSSGNIVIDFDDSFNCGDKDVDKHMGNDFHAILHQFNHIIEKLLVS